MDVKPTGFYDAAGWLPDSRPEARGIEAAEPERPKSRELSVVVTITHGENHIHRCLGALSSQKGVVAEIIVPVYPSLDDVKALRERWPDVSFIEIPEPPPEDPSMAHWQYDRRRAIGLCAATGRIVAMTEDHAIPSEGWCESIMKLHSLEHAVIGGAIEHSGSGLLNWAVYFCDFGRYQRPFSAGPAVYVSDINVSYKRAALEKCRALRSRFYHETAVHGYLESAGETLWLTPDLVIGYDRGPLNIAGVLAERYDRARVFAGRRAQELSWYQRAVLAVLSPGLPLLLAGRRLVSAARGKRHFMTLLAALPIMLLLLSVWSLGELTGYMTARPYARLRARLQPIGPGNASEGD